MATWNRRLQAAARHEENNKRHEVVADDVLPDDLHEDDRAAAEALLALARTRGEYRGTLLVRGADDHEPTHRFTITVADGGVETTIGPIIDVVSTDALTSLPTRPVFVERVDQALRSTERNGRVVAVLYLDIDDFKALNDSFGYDRGDEAIRSLARELRATIRPADAVARLSGDEFAVMCADLYAPAEAKDLAERIRVACQRSQLGEGFTRGVTVSIGVAIGDYRDDALTLLGDADTALQHAKVHGRDRWELFTPTLRTRTDRRLAIATRLHEVLDGDGVSLAYQPIVEIDTGEIAAFEALIRDHLVEGFTVAPRELVAAADDVGLIRRVEASVLRASCRRLGEWNRCELDTTSVLHVNVTRHRLTDAEFPLMITQCLAASDLPGERLCLEIATRTLLEAGTDMLETIDRIHEMGVLIALDEFESSAAALRLLAQVNVDRLKLDRRLIAMLPDPGAEALVRSTLQTVSGRGITTIAVGVETEAQRAALHDMGCELAQGYLFSPPVPDDDMVPMMQRLKASA